MHKSERKPFTPKPKTNKPEENTQKTPDSSEKPKSPLSSMNKKFRSAALGVMALAGADLINTQEAQADITKISYEQMVVYLENKEWDKIYNKEYQELFTKYPKEIQELKADILGSFNMSSMYQGIFQPNKDFGLGKVPDFSSKDIDHTYDTIDKLSDYEFFYSLLPAILKTQRVQSAISDRTNFYKEIMALHNTKKGFFK